MINQFDASFSAKTGRQI